MERIRQKLEIKKIQSDGHGQSYARMLFANRLRSNGGGSVRREQRRCNRSRLIGKREVDGDFLRARQK